MYNQFILPDFLLVQCLIKQPCFLCGKPEPFLVKTSKQRSIRIQGLTESDVNVTWGLAR
ncbi:hypothetical protein D3C74_317710 [compost metagenome]